MNPRQTQISRWLRTGERVTLLGVCPNTRLVTEAAVLASAEYRAPVMFAATLNQVDIDGGYTGWTPDRFANFVHAESDHRNVEALPLCLDHGGPNIKDNHADLDYDKSLYEVKQSINACVAAGYQLIHIDCTVPAFPSEPLDSIVDRTVELIEFTEHCVNQVGQSAVDYEIGTDEVEGGITEPGEFEYFVHQIVRRLKAGRLPLPVFVVAQVGTSLETTTLDEAAAKTCKSIASNYGIGLKCHYGDYTVPRDVFRRIGAAGVNVGPEFSAVQFRAFDSLGTDESRDLIDQVRRQVIEGDRWRKWLLEGEPAMFEMLSDDRKTFLLENCSRYVWANPQIQMRMFAMFEKDKSIRQYVVEEIKMAIARYLQACGLVNFFS